MSIAIPLTLAGCLIAGFCDWRTRRIPNWLTGALALGAIVAHAMGGWKPMTVTLAVMAGLSVAGTLLYSRGGIGGGDIKLAIAGSGMLGYPLFIPFLIYTALGGGVLALLFILVRPNARPSLSRAVGLGGRETLPYALAFALGAFLLTLSQSVAPFLRINLS